jgi:glycosyltransferase involved in cell wall biosynthesis
MKICFITNSTISKHATMKRAFGMTKPLIALGHEVTIYLQDAIDNKEAISQCLGVSAKYFQPGSLLHERKQKQIFLQQHHFDVVHICGLGFRNAVLPIGKTFTVMDHVELESSLLGITQSRRLSQFALEGWSLLAYSGSVVASKYLNNLFNRRLNRLAQKRPILYLPYAYDPTSLGVKANSVQNLRAAYPGKKLIVYMGGMYSNYGCFEMLESFRTLAYQRHDFVALMLGRGPDLSSAIKFVKLHQLEQFVEFKGYIPEEEISSFLYGADVLLSPLHNTVSDWARCPSKLLMYIATQKPIVTCAIGEAWEYLGEDGFYYEPNSIDSMTNAIERAIEIEDYWKPAYDPHQHTWEVRVKIWLDWVEKQQLNSMSDDKVA